VGTRLGDFVRASSEELELLDELLNLLLEELMQSSPEELLE